MFSSKNEYDRGVNTFSPEGRLFQVEYALGAVKLGSTSIGVRVNEGIVLATERRIASPLMEPTHDLQKIIQIDNHIACATSGIIADARTLIEHARVEAQQHWFTYNERLSVGSCVESICELALDFSGVNDNKRKVMSRPFGVALLIGGVDEEGACLWATDPSGTCTKYQAAAVGSAHEGAEALLQEKYKPEMTLIEAEDLALYVLRQVMEEKLSAKNVEIMIIPTTSKKIQPCSTEEVEQMVARLPPPEHPNAATLNAAA